MSLTKAGTVGVVMSTYVAEKSSNLEACLESLFNQTIAPDQILLVIDGPIGSDQEKIISKYSADTRIDDFKLIRLASNCGLAHSLNAGLAHCTSEFLMRHDSDDICTPDRLELQLAYAQKHTDIDMVTSWSEEFFENGEDSQLKVSPTSHDAIVRALRWRNILVHPTVFMRTESLRAIGGYSTRFDKLEDYDMFIRLVLSGAKLHVIPKVLVRVRSSMEQRMRRGGFSYFLTEWRFRHNAYKSGFLSLREFITTASMYSVFRLISGPMRKRIYAMARTSTKKLELQKTDR